MIIDRVKHGILNKHVTPLSKSFSIIWCM